MPDAAAKVTTSPVTVLALLVMAPFVAVNVTSLPPVPALIVPTAMSPAAAVTVTLLAAVLLVRVTPFSEVVPFVVSVKLPLLTVNDATAMPSSSSIETPPPALVEPLSVVTQTGTLYNAPPPTQGLASLIILALFERLRVARAESFEHVHGIVEATKRAFRVRDQVITDPDKITADLGRYFLPAFLDAEAATGV